VAGASGVIGSRLIPLLVAAGHQVTGMTRTPGKVKQLQGLGAEAVVCDVFDAQALREVVVASRPELILDELTDLPDDLERLQEHGLANARIRREGTSNLLEAAAAAGVGKIVAQSIAWKLEGERGAAVDELQRLVLGAGGVVIRYGQLYGLGTYYPIELPPPPRIGVDDAARRTLAALDAPSGVIVLTDDSEA